MNKYISVAIATIGIVFSSPIYASPSEEVKLANYLRATFASKTFLDNTMRMYGLTGEKRQIVEKFTKTQLSNDVLLKRVAKIIIQVVGTDLKDINSSPKAAAIGKQVGLSLIEEFTTRGLQQLSTEDLRAYIRYDLKRMYTMSPSFCRKYQYGPRDAGFMDEIIPNSKYFYETLSVNEVREIVAIHNKAFTLGANENAYIEKPSQGEIDIATRAFGNALDKECNKLEASDCSRIFYAMLHQNGASDKDLCDAAKLTYRAIYSLDDLLFKITVRDFLSTQ